MFQLQISEKENKLTEIEDQLRKRVSDLQMQLSSRNIAFENLLKDYDKSVKESELLQKEKDKQVEDIRKLEALKEKYLPKIKVLLGRQQTNEKELNNLEGENLQLKQELETK